MKVWDFNRKLDKRAGTPLFLQLVALICSEIADGRLEAGARLPSSRQLARLLGVNRNTVLSAYGELVAEGWVTTRPAGGTYVGARRPEANRSRAVARRHRPTSAPYEISAKCSPDRVDHAPRSLLLARGAPDVRLLPTTELARSYRRVLLRQGRELLFYGEPRGYKKLRVALSKMLTSTRGVPAAPDTLLVTRGSQMAIDLVARALLSPGDVIAVEALGHPSVWSALRLTGAELVPIAVDANGLCVDALEQLALRRRVRAVYVTPHHQFPTTVILPPDRRRALLALARHHGMAIIEDDYDHEFHYDVPPVAPMASEDDSGVVIYVGTLSKILAPGLRLGFVVAPRDVTERLLEIRMAADLQGDHTTEAAVADLFEEGEVQRHVRRMQGVYHRRRDALVGALRRTLGHAVRFTVPAGGMAIWAEILPPHDVETWAARAAPLGVVFRGAACYDFHGRAIPFARLGFTFLREAELAEAVCRMSRVLIAPAP
ncbi:MAG TPA: PLP-dependent aminotransferase family protein [Polyangiaceae bacterium]|nr:PLP-dependent aminotransferase family protein [Polyangiaceae bacterium]